MAGGRCCFSVEESEAARRESVLGLDDVFPGSGLHAYVYPGPLFCFQVLERRSTFQALPARSPR